MSNASFHCGMRNAECGLARVVRVRSQQSAIRSPHSKIRAGVTLLEVLVSMGVMTVGILGVAALFPVGSFYILRGEIADRADAAAAQAFNDSVTDDRLDPANWVYAADTDSNTERFNRSYASDFRTGYAAWASGNATVNQLIAQFGSVCFIDPVRVASGIDQGSNSSTQFSGSATLRWAPASLARQNGITDGGNAWWSPWTETGPIARVTIADLRRINGLPAPASSTLAELLSTLTDDLSTEHDVPADEPAQQLALSQVNSGVRLKRQNRGHFSYLISVVPRTFEAWTALPFGGRGQEYDVSAVVFYRRQPNRYDTTDDYDGIETTVLSERACSAAVTVQGTSGGEVRLYANTGAMPDRISRNSSGDFPNNLPWKDLEVGRYVMLMGPAPASYNSRPLLFAQWYRVIAIDDSDVETNGNTYLGPTVALRGPDWPWAASGDNPTNAANLSDDLRLVILDGAAAVHTRTLRLDAGATWRE